jgi:hypothetical protein
MTRPTYNNPMSGNTVLGPFRCVNMLVKIITPSGHTYTVGVVEGMDITMSYKGGPEAIYGTRIQVHSAGAFDVTFTLTRWYFADAGQQDLLLNLMQSEVEFQLEGMLYDKSGQAVSQSTLKITGCRIYKYRPRTGGANDIIGEEGSGSGTNWDLSEFIDGETTP